MSSYFIFKITQGPGDIVTKLEKINHFTSFKEAKQNVRELRQQQAPDTSSIYKIMFAENELQAEELLMEKRDAPVVLEWEK
jgi:hypothetical protein